MNIKKTANLLLNFATKRIAELLGILISIGGVLLFIALMTYSPDDPNFIFPKDKEINSRTPTIETSIPPISISRLIVKINAELANFFIFIINESNLPLCII